MTRAGPVDRVRGRLAGEVPDEALHLLPRGFQRIGSVLIVKLPESLRPYFPAVAAAYRSELGVVTVLRRTGPIEGDYRLPSTERLSGTSTEAETREHGVVYRLDAARIMFSAGNRSERIRLARSVEPGEHVADLFAGIGYFTLPIAVHSHAGRIVACEANPASFAYLRENLRRNHVEDRVEAILGPNESAPLRERSFDRVVLGYLPSAVPWVTRAVALVRSDGGWLHVHEIVSSRDGVATAEAHARASVERAGGRAESVRGREVKAYGPGRMHTVVDLRAIPPAGT